MGRSANKTGLSFIGGFILLVAGSSASAQVLEEITVVAQKRVQDIQDVGISITAVSGNQLRELGITNSEDLMMMVPGLVVGTFGSQATTTPTIRGISQNDFADHNESPIAIYTDGAYNSFIGGAGFNMFDVERVEVLRGPQGTLFGRNATGGLIHVITRKPTEEFEGYAELSAGEYSLGEFEGAASGKLMDGLLGRLSLATRIHDGYIDNTLGGDLQNAENISARLQLSFQPSDTMDVLLNLRSSIDNVTGSVGYATPRAIFDFADPAALVFNSTTTTQFTDFCTALFDGNVPQVPIAVTATSTCSGFEDPNPGNPYRAAIDNPGYMDRKVHGVTATIEWDVNESTTLTSITDFQSLERDYSEDTDGTSFRLFNFFSFMDSDQFSQELRLNGQGDAATWVLGAYYIDINHDIRTGIDAVPDENTLINANPDVLFPFITDNRNRQQTDSWALFAQAEYEFSPQWTLIGGLRWTEDDKEMNIDSSCGGDIFDFVCFIVADPSTVQGSGFSGKQSDGDYSAKLQLDYRPNDDWLVYAGITRGQKGGGFNAAAIASITPDLVPYRPEILTNYEVGFKSTVFDGKARFNGGFFFYDYEDYQAFTLTGLTPTVFNTDAEVNGFELELQSSPAEGLDVVLGVAYLETTAENVPNNLLPGSVNLGDQQMPQSPEWSYNGLLRYEWPALGGQLAIQGDINFVDERVFNTVNHPALFDDSYTLANARLTYTSGDERWKFALWVKNLTEDEYTSFAFDFSGSDGTVPGTINSPRWVGATATFNW